jgi:hypothetical protein
MGTIEGSIFLDKQNDCYLPKKIFWFTDLVARSFGDI